MSQAVKRSRPTNDARPPTSTTITKRSANTTTTKNNAQLQTQVKLANPKSSKYSNVLQQQFDAIIAMKSKAINDVTLYPLHVNDILKHCTMENITQSPHELTTALQALSSTFVHHLKAGNLRPTQALIPKLLDLKATEIEQKKIVQFRSFLDFLYSLLRLDPIQHSSLHQVCFKVAFELIAAVGNVDTGLLSADTEANPLEMVLYSYLASNILDPTTISKFYTTKLAPYDDIRYFTFSFLLLVLPHLDQQQTKTHWVHKIPNCDYPTFKTNVLSILSLSKFSHVTGKRLVQSSQVSSSMSNYSTKQRTLLSKVWLQFFKAIKIGDRSLTIGSTQLPTRPIYDDISIYTRIYAVMDTLILPNIVEPLLLSDFIIASFTFGGLIAVQALSSLFTLMIKHKLEYPQFFSQLYNICTLDILYSTYNITFFKLLNLVLQGNYLPLYLVIGFIKKLCRLALFGPSTCTIYITALVFNVYRKHPMIAYLINRKASIIGGVAKNAQMSEDLMQQPQPSTTSTTELGPQLPTTTTPTSLSTSSTNNEPEQPNNTMNDSVNLFALLKPTSKPKQSKSTKFLQGLTLTTAPTSIKGSNKQQLSKSTTNTSLLSPSPTTSTTTSTIANDDQLMSSDTLNYQWSNGQDPFIIDLFGLKSIAPESTHGPKSSLIELKDLVNHFYQQVRINAKLLFDDNAPKHAADISHLLVYLSYHTVIQQALTFRAKHLIPTSFQKPLGLLGRSERIVDADEQFDEDARKRGELLDHERNTIESIFMW